MIFLIPMTLFLIFNENFSSSMFTSLNTNSHHHNQLTLNDKINSHSTSFSLHPQYSSKLRALTQSINLKSQLICLLLTHSLGLINYFMFNDNFVINTSQSLLCLALILSKLNSQVQCHQKDDDPALPNQVRTQ